MYCQRVGLDVTIEALKNASTQGAARVNDSPHLPSLNHIANVMPPYTKSVL